MDLSSGKLTSLVLESKLSHRTIKLINSYHENFFLSGSFLMYPWVNRLSTDKIEFEEKNFLIDPILKDETGKPIHGLYFRTTRVIQGDIQISEEFIEVIIRPEKFHPEFPEFIEKYILKTNSIEVELEFSNRTDNSQYFSVGFHPYIQLENSIENIVILSNLTHSIRLEESLLPKRKDMEELKNLFPIELGKKQLDHSFYSENKNVFVKLIDKISGDSVLFESLEKEIPLNYFQFYTPPDRTSIAIEPMSSVGDVFANPISKPIKLLPKETKSCGFKITLE
ncbi:MAG: aldose 1-epimerase [Leptospiraceae bacterium]|nr:aldose 1-epimerase [Leptospiraceae bacterium]